MSTEDVTLPIFQAAVKDLDNMVNDCLEGKNRSLAEFILNSRYNGVTWDTFIELASPEYDVKRIVEVLKDASMIHKENPMAHCIYARALWLVEDYVEAAFQLHEAITLKPTLGLAHGLLGETYFLMGNYTEAMSVLNKAITLQENFARAVSCRAYTQKYMADDLNDPLLQNNRVLRLLYYNAAIKDFTNASLLTPHKKNEYSKEVGDIRQKLANL